MSEYFEHGKISHSDDISFLFLAPTGAQRVALSVCPTAQTYLFGSDLQADFKQN